jgi:hypothetical protein
LPGEKDIRRSALSMTWPNGTAMNAKAYGWALLTRIASPIAHNHPRRPFRLGGAI